MHTQKENMCTEDHKSANANILLQTHCCLNMFVSRRKTVVASTRHHQAACLAANKIRQKQNLNLLWQGDASVKCLMQRRLRVSLAQCSSARH